MLERLDRAFSSQRQFLADTSHDLRTPLTVIRSNVDLLLAHPGSTLDDWKQAGEVIRRNAEKMSKMIEDLLASARLQTGRAQSVELDLADLVKAKVDDFAALAGAEEVRIGDRATTARVSGVEIALDRALTNLMENAVKAAPPSTTVYVGSGVVGDWAWMGVADSGAGLPDEPGDRLGLGLSIVTQIAEGHGGRLVSLPGNEGRGTTMVVWIPRQDGVGGPPEGSPFTDTS
jgi:signal transduction histidine kinase